MSFGVHIALEAGGFVAQIVDPVADAPAGLKATVGTVLGLLKWISISAVVALLMSSGAVAFAAEKGHGKGLSPEMKDRLAGAVIALIVISSGAEIANFIL